MTGRATRPNTATSPERPNDDPRRHPVYLLTYYLARNLIAAGGIMIALLFVVSASSYSIYYGRYGLSFAALHLSYIDAALSLMSPFMLLAMVLVVVDIVIGYLWVRRIQSKQAQNGVPDSRRWNWLAWILPSIVVVFSLAVLIQATMAGIGERSPSLLDPFPVHTPRVTLTAANSAASPDFRALLQSLNQSSPLLLVRTSNETMVYSKTTGLVRLTSADVAVTQKVGR